MTRVSGFVCFFLFLAGAGSVHRTGPTQKDPKATKLDEHAYFRAYALLRSGKYLQAQELYLGVCGQAQGLGDPKWAGRCLTFLGNCRYSLFRYREALDTYLQARRYAESAADWISVGALDVNISSLYLLMGDLDAAAHEGERALGESSRGGFPDGMSRALIQLGVIRARQGRMDESAAEIGRAIEMAYHEGNLATAAEAWDHWGEELLARSALFEADRALTEAYRLRKLHRLGKLDSSYYNLARLRIEQGAPESALHLLGAALDRRHRPDSLNSAWVLYHALGRAHQALHRPADAFRDFRTALNLARSWRLEVLPADFTRVASEVQLDRIYSSFIDAGNRLYFATRRQDLARETFRAAEEDRAASLHALQALPKDWREALPLEYWDALSQLHSAEVRLLSEDSEALRAEMRRLRSAVLEMEAAAGSNPEISSAGLAERTERHLPPDAALLSFHLGQEQSFLWAISRERFRVYRLPGEAELAADISRFSQAVRTGAAEAPPLGRGLYGKLFGRLDPAFVRKSRWILALDEQLFRVPFGALIAGRSADGPVYLAERHSIRVTTGALAPDGPKSWREVLAGKFLGVGDAIYNTADPRWNGGSKERRAERPGFTPFAAEAAPAGPHGPMLTRLAGAGREVESCARAWDPRPGTAFLLEGGDACPERLRDALRTGPSVVHIAAHFLEASAAPRYSMIAMSLGRSGDPEWLSPLEITRYRIQTGLVVLSGCSSGRADVLPASGLMGLTRAWLAAGARAVVASHWPTPDDSGTLFVRFYKHFRDTPDAGPAVALQRAQLDMLRAGGWRSYPQYWATYFVAGDL
jgi:CHAT domain-containing protein